MKRKSKLLIVAIVVVMIAAICAVTLTACDKTDTKIIDQFYEKLTTSGNFTMKMTVSPLSIMSITMKIDGDKAYTLYEVSGESDESYVATVDGKVYTYTKDGDTWYKDAGIPVEDIEDDEHDAMSVKGVKDMLDSKNYTYNKSDKVFEHKDPASVDFAAVEGVTLTSITLKFEDNNCKISLGTKIEGMSVTYILAISDVGSTVVTLPNADIRHDGYEIDDVFYDLLDSGKYEIYLTVTMNIVGVNNVTTVRFLADGDKYQMLSVDTGESIYYYVDMDSYVIHKYMKENDNWTDTEVDDIGFIISLDDLYTMLNSDIYEWSDEDELYKLANGFSITYGDGEHDVYSATLTFDAEGNCIIDFDNEAGNTSYNVKICNIGTTNVTLPNVNQ
ncbi:MAG: hypothetical protein K2M44_05350 [Clostridia bacterium]|nr:hypothetical protein [Clostridia bacterium]